MLKKNKKKNFTFFLPQMHFFFSKYEQVAKNIKYKNINLVNNTHIPKHTHIH